jgi:hypothetical protein
MPSSDCGNFPVSCSVRQNPSAPPQPWCRASWPMIAAIRRSPTHASLTTTPLRGSLPARAGALFFTRMQVSQSHPGAMNRKFANFTKIFPFSFYGNDRARFRENLSSGRPSEWPGLAPSCNSPRAIEVDPLYLAIDYSRDLFLSLVVFE